MKRLLLSLGLLLLSAGVFAPVRSFPFLNYDDHGYVSGNGYVSNGLSREGTLWALSTTRIGNWMPLTWISHMFTVELFGLNAGAHHLVNVALHAVAAILLFHVLAGATGARGPAAFAAAIFAVHPLHVESVAWISERKDVLVGLFWMLTLLLHLRAVRNPSRGGRLAVSGAFILSLLAKPMAVTLPVVLLLLDFWPLGRMNHPDGRAVGRRLVLEKTPLFLIAVGYGVLTLVWQARLGVVTSFDAFPPAARAANAVASAMAYFGAAAWPAGLSPYYPYPTGISFWKDGGSALFLSLSTVAVVRARRTRPYLLAGWLWFLVGLLPVIGLVQVGWQARADRYTYLPLVGIAIATAWAVRAAARNFPLRSLLLAVAALVVIATLAVAARAQVWIWRDTETLFTRALDLDGENWFAHEQLGHERLASGKTAEALHHFERAVRSRPPAENVYLSLAALYIKSGRHAAAVPVLRQAVALNPGSSEYRLYLGKELLLSGQRAEASGELEKAVRRNSGLAEAHYLLGLIRDDENRTSEAEQHYRKAVSLEPGRPEGWYKLGMLLIREGRLREALPPIDAALLLNPTDPGLRRDLEQARRRAGE